MDISMFKYGLKEDLNIVNLMNPSVITSEVVNTAFNFYSDEEKKNSLAVCKVENDSTIDTNGRAIRGGLYDPRMGPVDFNGSCLTCGLRYGSCPGHLGYIELNVPVYYPMLFTQMFQLLRSKCFYCHRLRLSDHRCRSYLVKLQLLEMGDIANANTLDDVLQPPTNVFDGVDSSSSNRGKEKQSDSYDHDVNQHSADIDRILKDYEMRFQTYCQSVQRSTEAPSSGSLKKDRYIQSLQSEVIDAFNKTAIAVKACENCGAYSPPLRKDGHTKIFRRPLQKKLRDKMRDQKRFVLKNGVETLDRILSHQASSVNSAPSGSTSGTKFSRSLDKDDYVEETDMEDDEDDKLTANTSSIVEHFDATEDSDEDGDAVMQTDDEYLTPVEVEAQLRLLWMRCGDLLRFIWGRAWGKTIGESSGSLEQNDSWQIFITRILLVPPNRFRAAGKLESSSGGGSAEHPQNVHLKKVLQSLITLKELRNVANLHSSGVDNIASIDEASNQIDLSKIVSAWLRLQNAVNCYMDSTKDTDANRGVGTSNGIRQVLEKKEGLFRRHMMGKRVNFCCRSVISPDPYIGTNEIGIPVHFARSLHYPTPVNSFNVKLMRKLVENGPHQYPGANQIETAEGRIIKLDKLSPIERAGKAKLLLSTPGVRVHRHLVDGDFLLVNRQPTLHKPGIMAHRARVLQHVKEQTLRMHYANCNTYNADFDGDEMNCHFVQSELARAEGNFICNTDNQYIGPTDGAPLRGLIQDHVASGVKLTCKDTFLSRSEFQQLLFVAVCGLPGTEALSAIDSIEMPAPAVLKPRRLWTGKQVVSALIQHLCRYPLPPLQLDARTKTPATAFGEEHNEHNVVFRRSELLCGVLDKAAMGASSLGIVHTVYELYGPELAGRLLSAFGRVFTYYLQGAGHSCGIQDLTLTESADQERRNLLRQVQIEANSSVQSFLRVSDGTNLEEAMASYLAKGSKTSNNSTTTETDQERRRAAKAELDSAIQSSINRAASAVIKACLPNGLQRSFLQNHFTTMVSTGAKGSSVNQSQICCFLGQQALEGQRVPLMVSGKSLPSFKRFDTSARAGGFVQDRFLTGVKPQEYYFHCMAGREGLVDTAVKTARSGYLQRCLVKHLEGLRIHYDMTVRDSGGGNQVVQFLYGEDGLDPVAAALLGGNSSQMRFIARNNQALAYKHSLHAEFFSQGFEMNSAQEHHKQVQDAKKLVALSSGRHDIAHISQGSVICARRKKFSSLDWDRSNVDGQWHTAVVIKARHGSSEKNSSKKVPSYDIKYSADGVVAKKVPAFVLFHRRVGAGGGNIDIGSVASGTAKLYLIKPGVPDPAMSVLPLNRSVGACSERIQEAIRQYVMDAAEDGIITSKGSDSTVTAASLELLVWVKYMRSLACPGEAVGCVAAQGVGEPSTQMTLNTFHLAGHGGANVTLGIPRLREIIMTASRALKTPTMFAPMVQLPSPAATIARARALARKLSRLCLSQLLHHHGGIEVREFLRRQGNSGSRWERIYRVKLNFQKSQTIESAFGVTFEAMVNAVKSSMLGKLDYFIKLEQRRAGESASGGFARNSKNDKKAGQAQSRRPSLHDITGTRNAGPDVADRGSNQINADELDGSLSGRRNIGRRVRDVLSEEADPGEMIVEDDLERPAQVTNDVSDEDDSDDDGADVENNSDLGNLKLQGGGKEVLGYTDDGDEDSIGGGGYTTSTSAITTGFTDTDLGETDHLDEETDIGTIASSQKTAKESVKSGTNKSIDTKTLTSFQREAFSHTPFDELDKVQSCWIEMELCFHSKARRLLMAQLVEKAATLTMVRATKLISGAYAVEQDQLHGVQTSGVNFQALWALPEGTIQIDSIKSNDIYAILTTYGVEAARQSIVAEIKNVFGVYGISVDPRHLSLIADFMTRFGSFTPLNRTGMQQFASPFQQMSFESTCTFLSKAAQEGLSDSLQSPSAQIVLGNISQVGTGCFDLMLPLKLKQR